jgi:hypothetical protein
MSFCVCYGFLSLRLGEIWSNYNVSESRLVAYDFDPNAESLYALELLPVQGGQ